MNLIRRVGVARSRRKVLTLVRMPAAGRSHIDRADLLGAGSTAAYVVTDVENPNSPETE